MMSPAEIWGHVEKSDGCWTWTGRTNGNGRGRVRYEGRHQYAYRVVWELTYGEPIPGDLMACHHCDNPICVNPAHIFVGTALDNARDAKAKGRTRSGPPRYGLDHHLVTVGPEDVARAVEEYMTGDERQVDVAARYGVSQNTLSTWVGAKGRPDAGLTPNRKLKPCGTHAAYARHLRRGEKACEPCLIAERAHCKVQRDKRAAAARIGVAA